MEEFVIRFNELLNEKGKIEDLVKYLNLKSASTIYNWVNGDFMPSLPNLIKIANYFSCNLDYLLGLTDNHETVNNSNLVPFNVRLREIIDKNRSSQYKLLKDDFISRGHLNSWLNLKRLPSTANAIKIANYFHESVDFVVGRV
ncbi:MAG: helix-turn-helix transcriptional regulator [Clostridiales bacterium]|nr:helix-turn-helix transcriptional regulator [Clostridiales bacterium]